MTANGTDPDSIDIETFNDICIMYADGMIGNKSIIEILGCLTAGIYNYMRSENQPPYKLQDIIPRVHDYINPPLTKQELHDKTQETLKAFVFNQAPANMFKDK